jgi:hypothetical protein
MEVDEEKSLPVLPENEVTRQIVSRQKNQWAFISTEEEFEHLLNLNIISTGHLSILSTIRYLCSNNDARSADSLYPRQFKEFNKCSNSSSVEMKAH